VAQDWACICPKVIEAHHGAMWVENNLDGMGATFTFYKSPIGNLQQARGQVKHVIDTVSVP